MLITPRELLDTSFAQLETLAAFLAEQLGEDSAGSEHVTTETRACNEILTSIRAVILRIQAARPGLNGYCLGVLEPRL